EELSRRYAQVDVVNSEQFSEAASQALRRDGGSSVHETSESSTPAHSVREVGNDSSCSLATFLHPHDNCTFTLRHHTLFLENLTTAPCPTWRRQGSSLRFAASAVGFDRYCFSLGASF